MKPLHWLVGLGLAASALAMPTKAQTPPQPTLGAPAPPQTADKPQDAQAEALKRIRALPWRAVHDMQLPNSKATLRDLPGFVGVTGADAQTFRAIVDGHSDPSIEGDVMGRGDASEVLMSWHDEGYVDAKDFADIDPDKLIESVREATFAANEESVRAGQHAITAVDWLRKPTWNDNLHTAYWMLEGVHDDGQRTVNAIALKLGRRGYEKMIWITSPDQIGHADDLSLAQDAHKYAPGDRYEDHVQGDRLAAYGIAGLVAGVIGLKAAKIAGLGALLLVFKKFFVLLLLPFIWVWNKIKSLFRRRDAEGS